MKKKRKIISFDFCIGCGALLPQNVYECPACGFDNSFGRYQSDLPLNDDLLGDLSDDFNPEEETGY